MKQVKVVLASRSPRRRQMLEDLNIPFEVCIADTEERLSAGKSPAKLARMLALEKARACFRPGCLIIGMDTLVVFRGSILGKPDDRAEAVRMLQRLSGKTHEVVTGVALLRGEQEAIGSAVTKVAFRKLSASEIRWYVESGEPMDKAGAYGIQGLARIFITRIDGCYFNVVGFPMDCFQRLLARLDLSVKDLIGDF